MNENENPRRVLMIPLECFVTQHIVDARSLAERVTLRADFVSFTIRRRLSLSSPTPKDQEEVEKWERIAALMDEAETIAHSALDKINKAIEEMILPDDELTHPNNATWEDRKMPPQLPKTL